MVFIYLFSFFRKQLLGPKICIYNDKMLEWLFRISILIKSIKVHKNYRHFGTNSHKMIYLFIILDKTRAYNYYNIYLGTNDSDIQI